MKEFEMKTFISELVKNSFVKECGIPLGYKATFPTVRKENDHVLLTVPFNKTQRTKTRGVSAVFPITYTVTFELHVVKSIPEAIKKISRKEEGYSAAVPVGFESLACSKKCADVDFGKPLETFPHKSLKELGKEEYQKKTEKLYEGYDILINDLLGIEKAAGIDKLDFKNTLRLLICPVTKQMYRLIDPEFYEEYLKA